METKITINTKNFTVKKFAGSYVLTSESGQKYLTKRVDGRGYMFLLALTGKLPVDFSRVRLVERDGGLQINVRG